MHEMHETFCGVTVYPVATYGVMEIYSRQGYRSLHVPKYVVFHQDGRALEEFKTLRKATQWAKNNRKG
jgi:hypothetical protein